MKIFREGRSSGQAWQPFLNLLNRQDEFVQHMTARIIAKLACWHPQLMDKSDLHHYLSWLKDQLKMNVSYTTLPLLFKCIFHVKCSLLFAWILNMFYACINNYYE